MRDDEARSHISRKNTHSSTHIFEQRQNGSRDDCKNLARQTHPWIKIGVIMRRKNKLTKASAVAARAAAMKIFLDHIATARPHTHTYTTHTTYNTLLRQALPASPT